MKEKPGEEEVEMLEPMIPISHCPDGVKHVRPVAHRYSLIPKIIELKIIETKGKPSSPEGRRRYRKTREKEGVR